VDYRQYIEVNADTRFGKPCIKGTRISVFDVLGWLSSGMSIDEILADYPQLKKEYLLACLAYSGN